MNMKHHCTAVLAVLSVAVLGSSVRAQDAAAAPDAKPVAPAPALTSTNAMATRQALSLEMRDLSMKLRPAFEKIQNDEEMKAAMAEAMKAQEKLTQLREAKMRADPETAKLLDRMEAIRKEMSSMSGPGAPGAMPPRGFMKRSSPMQQQDVAAPAPKAP